MCHRGHLGGCFVPVFFALGGGCINIMNSVLTGNKVSLKTNTPTVWQVVVFVLLALPVY